MAVKTLKRGSSEKDKVKLLQEVAIMVQFSHIKFCKFLISNPCSLALIKFWDIKRLPLVMSDNNIERRMTF